MLANAVRRGKLSTHICEKVSKFTLSNFIHKQGRVRQPMADDSSAGEDDGDGDINGIISSRKVEITMEEYQLHRTQNKLVVRQFPSKGLSFQVWPAASALCSLLDEMFWHHPGIITTAQQKTRIPNYIEQEDAPVNRCELKNPALGHTEVGHIAHLLLQRRGEKQALRVLELGAGTGMVGIASALLGAHVIITDLPHVLPNLEFNASANEESLQATKLGGRVCVKALRWGEEEDAAEVGHNFDLILASDVVYHENLFDPLLLTLKWLLLGKDEETGNPILLMAHLRRWKKDTRFFKKAKKLFDVRVVHRHPPLPGSRLGVIVYSFTKKDINRASV